MDDKIINISSNNEESEDKEDVRETINLLRRLEYYYFLLDCNALQVEDSIWKQLMGNFGDNRLSIQKIYLQEISNFNEFLALKPQVIIIYAEVYLKTEWERVKYEIENGINKGYEFDDKYNEHLKKIQTKIDDIENFIDEEMSV